MRSILFCSAALGALSASLAIGADWTRFRGPDASGVSEETRLPIRWNAEENVVWKTTLPGFGTSSPITFEDRIFLTCYSGYGLNPTTPGDQEDLQQRVLCLNRADGKIIWDKARPGLPPVAAYDRGRVNLHGYASATPATDGKAVYAFFGRAGVVAYSLAGDELWHTGVGEGIHSSWGSAASPVLCDNLVIVNACIESQSIVALDKVTGQVVWETEGIERSWSTPLIVELPNGSPELVVSMKGKILGLDPATGKQLWHSVGVDDYTCPAVIANDGIVYVTAGRSPQFFAVRAGGRGDVTDTHILWETAATPKVATPVYHQGYLYWVDQKGIACCADAETGDVLYRERLNLKGAGDTVYASLVFADGKLYGVSREDGAFVLAAGPKFQLLARNYLDDSSIFNATPTISKGQLLLRSDRYLYCIGD
jgi:outer membrane protein assembly factor BamB